MKEQIDTPTLIPTQTNSGVCELDRIEEMAECCPYFWNGACTVDAAKPTDCDLMCAMFGFMTSLLHAGYRRQSEGEWVSKEHISKSKRGRTIHYATYKCSVCGKWNGKHKQNYCPTCGAKMKGAYNGNCSGCGM